MSQNFSKEIFHGLGLRRSSKSRVLDVGYSWIEKLDQAEEVFFQNSLPRLESDIPILISTDQLDHLLQRVEDGPLREWLQNFKSVLIKESQLYAKLELIYYRLSSHEHAVKSTEEGYFKLQLISRRLIKPRETNLIGMFEKLENVAWTNYGPMLIEDVEQEKLKRMADSIPLQVIQVDKIPYLLNYTIPSGVRIADGTRVRLGAYLGEGSTIMPAGYVNFNSGSLGRAMIEGRISSGVLVEKNSDLGGGSSIMGTLSGGNTHVISVGSECLIGANAGIGISLGSGCTVAAGVYVTAASKVTLYDSRYQPIDLSGEIVEEGKNIVKAIELSGRDHLLFIYHSSKGKLICIPNRKKIELNSSLHKFN